MAAIEKLVRPSTSNGMRLTTPSSSLMRLLLPARAPTDRSTSSPPKTFARPLLSTSVVASTTPSALSTAVIRALSSLAVVGSVNWMSYAITLAPASLRRSMARAWIRRGNGQRRWRSPNVTSSIPTTTTSGGAPSLPRISKRWSTVSSSAASKTFAA